MLEGGRKEGNDICTRKRTKHFTTATTSPRLYRPSPKCDGGNRFVSQHVLLGEEQIVRWATQAKSDPGNGGCHGGAVHERIVSAVTTLNAAKRKGQHSDLLAGRWEKKQSLIIRV
uniref:Uncharacterized protein n=1 Tax=Grammatophora oceanica TaxID=210454 RepID=A0A7S1URI5_9STRA